jgi:hypothetical protein
MSLNFELKVRKQQNRCSGTLELAETAAKADEAYEEYRRTVPLDLGLLVQPGQGATGR